MHYDPTNDPYTSPDALRALAELAAGAPACECEADDDGATLVCAACRAADDDGRDEAFTGAEYTNHLAPADDDDVIPFP